MSLNPRRLPLLDILFALPVKLCKTLLLDLARATNICVMKIMILIQFWLIAVLIIKSGKQQFNAMHRIVFYKMLFLMNLFRHVPSLSAHIIFL